MNGKYVHFLANWYCCNFWFLCHYAALHLKVEEDGSETLH